MAKAISTHVAASGAKALMTAKAMTMNRYVISRIGMELVRYRMIPKMAKRPKANARSISTPASKRHNKNTAVDTSMKVNT